MSKLKKIHYSWEQLVKDCLILSKKLKSKNFDFVVAISRGGLIPAALLTYSLKIKKIGVIGYTHYLKDGVTGKLKLTLPPISKIKNSQVLLVDDITDTGLTLLAAVKILKNRKNKVTTATLHWKTKSKIKPDYFIHEIKDIWIVYSWEPTHKSS